MGDQAPVGGRRHDYWFPLVLLGFGLLALLGWDSVQVREDFGWFAYAPPSAGTGFLVTDQAVVVAAVGQGAYPMRDSSWAVLITLTLVLTVAWYGRRAGGPVRKYLAFAVGGGVAVPVAYFAAGVADTIPDSAGLVTSVALPLIVLGGLACFQQRLRLRVVGAGCLVVGVGLVLGAWSPGLLDPVIVVVGLLALARVERSRLLVGVAVAVLVAMVVFPGGTLGALLPASVLLAGGILSLVRRAEAV